MKKFYSIFPLCLFLFLMSCNKDNGSDSVCFENDTDEPIDLYINGAYDVTIDEENSDCFFFDDGCYDWYVEGVVSGFYSEGTVCVGPETFQTTIVIDD